MRPYLPHWSNAFWDAYSSRVVSHGFLLVEAKTKVMTDISVWLTQNGLGKHVDTFRANDIDFDVLPSLGEGELRELGLSLGDRKRLELAITHLGEMPSEPGHASCIGRT